MQYKDQSFIEVERAISQSGYTLADLVKNCSRYNSSLLNMTDENISICKDLYDHIDNGGLSKGDKGRKLEELSTMLFQRGTEKLLDVYKNCRTSTNEIDLLVRWTEEARLAGINGAFSFIGDTFLCEYICCSETSLEAA